MWGGDFYNFFLVDEDHLALVIGDVSGKGIPAALFMMVTNILISDRTRMGGGPAEILRFVNDNLCEHNKADLATTVAICSRLRTSHWRYLMLLSCISRRHRP